MGVSSLDQLADRLPPGRAQAKYRGLVNSLGKVVVVTLPYLEQPIWIVAHSHARTTLVSQGIPRSTIWTFQEWQELIELFGSNAASAEAVVAALDSSSLPPNLQW